MRLSRFLLISIILCNFLCIIPVKGEEALAKQDKIIIGTANRQGYQCDDGKLYYVDSLNSKDTSVYFIDVNSLEAKTIFSLPSIDADITIGNNEICYRKVLHQPPLVSYIGPYQYITLQIDQPDENSKTTRTNIIDAQKENVFLRCFFSQGRLFLSEDTGANDSAQSASSLKLYLIDETGNVPIRSYTNESFTFYESAILINESDSVEEKCVYRILSMDDQEDILLAKDADDYHWPGIIQINETIFISSNHQVKMYNTIKSTAEVLISDAKAGCPSLTYYNGSLYVYDDIGHLLFEYNLSTGNITRTIAIPDSAPENCLSVYMNGRLLVGPRDKTIYVYEVDEEVYQEEMKIRIQ